MYKTILRCLTEIVLTIVIGIIYGCIKTIDYIITKLWSICWSIIELIEDELRYIKLYRRLRRGKWYYYKLGRDTPWIKLFTHWTKRPYIDTSDVVLLETEDYSKGGLLWYLKCWLRELGGW